MSERSLEVCLSPQLIDLYDIEEKIVVVVDILRATSCFVAGLSTGVQEIIPFKEVEACMKLKGDGYVLAGERGGEKLDGFDLGNSPLEYLEQSDAKISVSTTNGTVALEAAIPAKEVIVGAFLNLSSTAKYLAKKKRSVLILCAGWKGRPNIEDSIYAGALANELKRDFEIEDDNLISWKRLNEKFGHEELVLQSSHVKRLKKIGVSKDINYCLQVDEFDTVVKFADGKMTLA